jgi:hypothetical protein
MKPNFTLIFALISLVVSCKEDMKDDHTIISDSKLLIGKEYFNTYPNDLLYISDAVIFGDSIKITFTSSCCDSKSWKVNLVGSETVLYSEPPQREIRLSLKNDELCDAICGRTYKFDLTSTKINGSNKIILNLSGWESQLIYNY